MKADSSNDGSPTAASGDPHGDLGAAIAHHSAGHFVEAEAAYRQLADVAEVAAETSHLLGILCLQSGRVEESERWMIRSIAMSPRIAAFHRNLCGLYLAMNRPAEAEAAGRHAIALDPSQPESFNNLGVALERQRQFAEAADAYQRSVALKPDYAEPHNNFGNVLRAVGRLDEAEAAQRRAIQWKPAWDQPYDNLAATQKEQGDQNGVLNSLATAMAVAPGVLRHHASYVQAMLYSEAPATTILAEARRYASRLTTSTAPKALQRHGKQKLHIGFVSSGLGDHPDGFCLLAYLEPLRGLNTITYCYNDYGREDAVHRKLQQRASHWRESWDWSDAVLANQVHRDGIDVLVNVSGFFGHNRLGCFALRPAPIQLAHFGYPGTFGGAGIEYRITDFISDPLGMTEATQTEKLIRLPHCAWVIAPPSASPEVSPLPAASSGRITLGCLNNPQKVTDRAVGVFSEILRRLPGSTLILLGHSCRHQLDRFSAHGIGVDRLRFVPRCGREDYLRVYHSIDIALDPFPYNGGVTSVDGLWMGVPFVSLIGDTYRSRQGLMLLSQVGLERFAVSSVAQYVQAAVELATDVSALSAIRSGLRQQLKQSPLMDGEAFAKAFIAGLASLIH